MKTQNAFKTFSLILIIKDNPKVLECSLISIESLNYPKEYFEVIVIDDGSKISTQDSIEYTPTYTIHWEYLERTSTSSRARARNKGASIASNDLLLFLDGDHFITPTLLKNYNTYFQYKKNKHVVLGTRNHYSHAKFGRMYADAKKINQVTPPSDFTKDERVMLQHHYNIKFNDLLGRWHLFWSCNFCIKRNIYRDIGGFDEQFLGWGLEDSELGYRLLKNNIDFELLDNPVWHHTEEQQTSLKKITEWQTNLQLFYKKYDNFDILEQILFEGAYMNAANLIQQRENWFEHYDLFETKLRLFKKHGII